MSISAVRGPPNDAAAQDGVGPETGVSDVERVVLWSEPKDLGTAHEDGDPFQTASSAADASLCVVDARTGRAAWGGAGCSLVSDSDARLGPLAEDPVEAVMSDAFFDAGSRPTCYRSEVAPGFAGACPGKLPIGDLPTCDNERTN